MTEEHAGLTQRQIYRFDRGRLARNLLGLLPMLGFPVVLHLTGRADPLLYTVFGLAMAALVAAVVYSAVRFKVVVDESGLLVRGRVRVRRVAWRELQSLQVRPGRDKGHRFMGPPPFRELVLQTATRTLVLSSLPLGEDAFAELVERMSAGDSRPGQAPGDLNC